MNCDVLVVGGGINGAGIARDAAGRGLSVVLLERGDLGEATSSASSKLIHGGLRYLEQFEFRLVAEALAEREVLLRVAGHLTWPIRFVMPHVPELRPRWMIRAGLFLYDHLARRSVLPGSASVRLDGVRYGEGLDARFTHGFVYSDCRVDDARLVVANAVDAHSRGAAVLVGTALRAARRAGDRWHVELSDGRTLEARALVNAAGPWVRQVLDHHVEGHRTRDRIRLVWGSHIVFPRLYRGEHAFILQNDDRRVVFMIPFEESFTLVGTTDVGDPRLERPGASDAEIDYLCRAVNRYLANPVSRADVRWSFTGVRPLIDDGERDPSAVSRDYTFRLDDANGSAPLLSVFGGKITTYRRLAEQALQRLSPYFPGMKGPWTAQTPLPGSAFESQEECEREVLARYPQLPQATVRGVVRRHGALAAEVLGDGSLGEDFGAGLTERELRYLVEREWARTAEDVLWRRTKAGLRMDARQRARVAERLAELKPERRG
ncbi:MAG TPA: glycerol-3-phosphate dehydrogenase [Burkholderiales bacterium]|nr:glycerol-3-phosphate dehydrogenase [Burkholderiales bacterium]